MNTEIVTSYVRAHPVPVVVGIAGLGIGYALSRRANKTASSAASDAPLVYEANGPMGPAGPAGPAGPSAQVPAPPPKPTPTPAPKPTVPASKQITDADKAKYACKGNDSLTYGRGSDASNIVCRNASTGKDYPVSLRKK